MKLQMTINKEETVKASRQEKISFQMKIKNFNCNRALFGIPGC